MIGSSSGAIEPIVHAPLRNAYDGKHCGATASIAHWNDTSGRGRAAAPHGSSTVVTDTSGAPSRSQVRYSNCQAVIRCRITPNSATSTDRDRTTVPGASTSKPGGAS